MPTRFGRVQKATALVPLALLSAAWTAGIAGAGGVATVSAQTEEQTSEESPVLPDGTSVPSEAIEAPASLSTPGVYAPGVPSGRAGAANVVRTASTNGIPSAALSAYQRASTVINAADKGCQVPWQLIAAIGRVESDHGRYGGNTLSDAGVSQPGIYGIPLNGKKNTSKISDTDAGQFDNDQKWDRAVGPMQFIPSTWSVVGVDADGDGERDPQNINDAALATAVYLCSGDEDLSKTPGQREAVLRYNHSQDYVDLVLSVMRAYTKGDFSEVPTKTSSASYFTPSFTPDPKPAKTKNKGGKGGKGKTVRAGGGSSSSGGSTASTGSSGSSGSSGGATGGSTGGSTGRTGGTGGTATSKPDPAPSGGKTVQKTTDTVKKTVKKTTGTVKKATGGGTSGGGTSGGTGGVKKQVQKATGGVKKQVHKATDGVKNGVNGALGN